MKILTWNCDGAFRNKIQAIKSLQADIVVIQECEDPNQSSDESYQEFTQNGFWIGDNKHKGLGIFAKPHIKLDKLNWSSKKLQYFIPCRINDEFNIIACWCHGARFKTHNYIGQLWQYMQLHKSKFGTCMIIGDLNANVFWDKPSRNWNHSDVVCELEEVNIHSLYHRYFDEVQGAESQPTFYLYKHLDKPYHMDYIFASEVLIHDDFMMSIGSAKDWMGLSDHMVLICEIQNQLKI
jgi:exonuclease III